MPFDPRRAEAPARVAPHAPAQSPERVMQTFLETLARLSVRASRR